MAWGCSVRECLSRITSPELTELMAFERSEPFGFHRDNLLMGQLAATVMNARQGNRRSFSPKDFMLRPRREMSVDEMISNLRAATGD
jgi:hypothetical protein